MIDRNIYLITFQADGVGTIRVMPNDTPAVVSGGYGGWTIVNRQRRIGLPQWQGKDPFRMQIPILFDGFAEANSQEIAISRLGRMALPTGHGEPPVVSVSGHSIPRPGPKKWVIESLDWGQNVIWDFAGNGVMARLRQDCTVNLIQYIEDDRIAFKSLKPGQKTKAKKPGWPKIYTVKKGDTLKKISAHYYGDASKWKKIADANGVRDPNKLKANQVLRIPAP